MSARTLELVGGLELHPVCALFPDMDDAELADLALDIKLNGQLEPATEYQGKLLDGKNRCRACEMVGIKPVIRPWDGRGDSPVAWALAKNLRRRQMTTGQRAMVAAAAVPMFEAEAKERQRAAGAGNLNRGPVSPVSADLREPGMTEIEKKALAHFDKERGKSAAAAAKATGATERSVEQAKRVTKASPALAKKVKDGKVSLHAAEQTVAAKARKESPAEIQDRENGKRLVRAISAAFKVLSELNVILPDGTVAPDLTLWPMLTAGIGSGRDSALWTAQPVRLLRALGKIAPIAQAIAAELVKGGK